MIVYCYFIICQYCCVSIQTRLHSLSDDILAMLSHHPSQAATALDFIKAGCVHTYKRFFGPSREVEGM